MRAIDSGLRSPNPTSDIGGVHLIKVRWFGFVRKRTLLRVGIVAILTVLSVILFLTSDVFTFVMMTLLVVIASKAIARYDFIGPDRWVRIYPEAGIYIAEHSGSGVIRHGETPEQALSHLEHALDERLRWETGSVT